MSDDEADPELLALLRQHLQGKLTLNDEPETGVLEGAEYVYDNAIDVALDMWSTKSAAAAIHAQMQEKGYSTASWAEHELHPKTRDEAALAFIFTMDLLNFSFWSEKPEGQRFAVSYRDRTWTGYWGLVAALQRALDEGGLAFTCNWCDSFLCVDGLSPRVGLSSLIKPRRYSNYQLRLLAERGGMHPRGADAGVPLLYK